MKFYELDSMLDDTLGIYKLSSGRYFWFDSFDRQASKGDFETFEQAKNDCKDLIHTEGN